MGFDLVLWFCRNGEFLKFAFPEIKFFLKRFNDELFQNVCITFIMSGDKSDRLITVELLYSFSSSSSC